MLFSNCRQHELQIPAVDEDGNAATVGYLTWYLCREVMKDSRKEMFLLDGHMLVSFWGFSSRLVLALLGW